MSPPRVADASERIDVLGVGISAIDPLLAVETIERWVASGQQNYVCVTGVHGVMEAQRDPELLHILNDSGLTTPDGMPMVWAAHRAGASHVRRVYGPDLMLAVSERASRLGWTCYLYGATDEVLERLRDRLCGLFPGLRIVGSLSPPFRDLSPEEDDTIVRTMNASAPDIVWVGLSTPKQERWMASHVGRLDATVLIGVGAAFDIHAGKLRQAPRWVQGAGLEWAFRLLVEPRRLWRRYARNVPSYLVSIARRPPAIVRRPAGAEASFRC